MMRPFRTTKELWYLLTDYSKQPRLIWVIVAMVFVGFIWFFIENKSLGTIALIVIAVGGFSYGMAWLNRESKFDSQVQEEMHLTESE